MTGTVQYKTGFNETAPCGFEEIYEYGNNFTGYHWDYDAGTAPDGPRLDAYIFHRFTNYNTSCVVTTTDTYDTIAAPYQSTAWWFGFLLAITTGFAAFILLWNARAMWKQQQEREK